MPLTPMLNLPVVHGYVLPAHPLAKPQHPHQLPLKHHSLLLLPLPAALWNLPVPTINRTGQSVLVHFREGCLHVKVCVWDLLSNAQELSVSSQTTASVHSSF